MTVHAIESALHDLGVKRQARTAFAEDASAFLKAYRLEPAESDMIANFDVAALQRAGASPLLTLGFWMMNEPGRSRANYLDRLNGRTPIDKSGS